MSVTIFKTNIYLLMEKSLKNDKKSLGSVRKKFLKFKIWKFRQFWVWIRTKLAGAKLSNILNKFLQNSFFVFFEKSPFLGVCFMRLTKTFVSPDWPENKKNIRSRRALRYIKNSEWYVFWKKLTAYRKIAKKSIKFLFASVFWAYFCESFFLNILKLISFYCM